MADSNPERFEDDLDEVSSAVKRCVGHTASLQRWAYNEEELDPVLEVHGLLESFAEAQSGLGFVEDALAGAVDQPADFGGVVRESHHGTAHALADRTLQAVADSLGSLLIGPGPGPNGPTGQWKANIPGIYAVGRQDYPKIRRALAALPRFDPDLLTAWLKKERVWGKRQYSATPPQAKPKKSEWNDGNAAQKNRESGNARPIQSRMRSEPQGRSGKKRTSGFPKHWANGMGRYKTKADLAEEKGINEDDVKKALERHRKRLERTGKRRSIKTMQ